jgi:Fe-S-cluster-containing dehydrogenase component
MKAQCMHCVDPACAAACMLHSLHKNEVTGVVEYDPFYCVGCRYCQMSCPFNVPKFEFDKSAPKIVKCELCRHRVKDAAAETNGFTRYPQGQGPACCEVCPREAVVYGTCGELKELAHRRMKADPERYNAKIYGDTDAGGTAVMYLTARGVSFEDLGLPRLTEEALPIMSERIQHGIYKWFAGPVALYGLLAWSVWRSKKHQDAHTAQGHAERQAHHHHHDHHHDRHHGEHRGEEK